MAGLTEAEARLLISVAGEPGNARIGQSVREHGAIECIRQPRLLPAEVARQIDDSNLRLLDSEFRWLTPGAIGWPAQLDLLGDEAPLGIWCHTAPPPSISAISIVGARSCTQYGEYVASELAAGVSAAGLWVVSGGAYGIDAAAHRGALAVSGLTVAVLAGGLDHLYPRSNALLFERIRERGLLISEYPPGMPALRHHFLVRNRLVAALGELTVVVEARLRSGALSSASHAARLGRDVMAVPGAITSAASAGCHQLIRDGAVLASSAEDVLELLRGDLPMYQATEQLPLQT